jgi:hypothetical protein
MRRVLIVSVLLSACGPEAKAPEVSPTDKWIARADASYRAADMDDAKVSVDEALKIDPKNARARLVAGKIALARLEFTEALRATEGLADTDAHMIRGRAFWYSNDIDRAADELDKMLKDPAVKDPWAREVSKLARRGQGRKPFSMEGGVVSAVEMPQAGPLLVVPCELEGENILALVATGVGELTLDSTTRKEPAWVSMRFGSIEVKDVPGLTQDLSGVSRQLGAPIKALLGVNVLRRMHVTFDRRASQFVVRREDPTAPPDASRVPLYYVRGGGMMLRAGLSQKTESVANLLVDTSSPFPLSLADASFGKAGVALASLRGDPGLPANYKTGVLPFVRVGGFDVPQTPAVQGANMDELRSRVDVDFGGVLGSGFLQPFRVTFGDEGRFVWLEGAPPPFEFASAPPPPTTAPATTTTTTPVPPAVAPMPSAPSPQRGPAVTPPPKKGP